MSDDRNPLHVASQSDCNPIPVFTCHVILSTDPTTGRVTGIVANLDNLAAEGTSERDVLLAVTGKFKALIKKHVADSKDIPWVDPPATAVSGESERFIPVHL